MGATAQLCEKKWFGLLALGAGLIVLGIAASPVFIALGGLAGFFAIIMLGKSEEHQKGASSERDHREEDCSDH